MGKKNNVNPDHYKTRGRERPGDDIVQEIHKQEFAQSQARAGGTQNFIPGAAPVGASHEAADTPPADEQGTTPGEEPDARQ